MLLQENYSDVISPRSQAAQLAPALSTIYHNVQAGYDLTLLPGLGLFYSEQNDEHHCPTVLAKFVRRLNALPQLSVIVTVRNVSSSLLRTRKSHCKSIHLQYCSADAAAVVLCVVLCCCAHVCGCVQVCSWDCKRSSLRQHDCSHVCSSLVQVLQSALQ